MASRQKNVCLNIGYPQISFIIIHCNKKMATPIFGPQTACLLGPQALLALSLPAKHWEKGPSALGPLSARDHRSHLTNSSALGDAACDNVILTAESAEWLELIGEFQPSHSDEWVIGIIIPFRWTWRMIEAPISEVGGTNIYIYYIYIIIYTYLFITIFSPQFFPTNFKSSCRSVPFIQVWDGE